MSEASILRTQAFFTAFGSIGAFNLAVRHEWIPPLSNTSEWVYLAIGGAGTLICAIAVGLTRADSLTPPPN